MSDFALDLSTEDLSVVNGDLVLTADENSIRQALAMRMRMILGEFFTDRSIGTDYFGRILGNHSFVEIDAELKRVILTTPGVGDFLDPIEYIKDASTRILSIRFRVSTDLGEITVDEPVGLPGA